LWFDFVLQVDADGDSAKDRKPRTFKFSCLSEHDKQSWMKDITEAIGVNKFMQQVEES